METKIIDAFGLQCPKPLVLAKKELDAGVTDLAVQVDNETAVKNLTRLGSKKGMAVSVDAIEGGWLISFAPGDGTQATDIAIPQAAPAGASCGPNGCGYAVFVNHDAVGEGDPQLGRNLVKMALYTLSEADEVPSSLLFMNGGVKLIAGPDAEQQCVDNVAALQEKGTEVLVCGTCLNFFGIGDDLKVGEVSNMYDILERMHEAAKVITL